MTTSQGQAELEAEQRSWQFWVQDNVPCLAQLCTKSDDGVFPWQALGCLRTISHIPKPLLAKPHLKSKNNKNLLGFYFIMRWQICAWCDYILCACAKNVLKIPSKTHFNNLIKTFCTLPAQSYKTCLWKYAWIPVGACCGSGSPDLHIEISCKQRT